MGSFRPGAGSQHLHWHFNFTGCIVETAPKSLRLRAGSNLPDKEFRYLRDRYSYGRRLLGLKFVASFPDHFLTFQHWQASAHIPHLSVLHRPVFLSKQLFGPLSLRPARRHPFSRSYGAILPSSLNNTSSAGL